LPIKETYGKFPIMSAHRTEQAVQRIEAALGRIAKISDTIRPAPPSVSGLVVKHESLRDSASNTLKELDDLLKRLEP